jgi:hypothetical protein
MLLKFPNHPNNESLYGGDFVNIYSHNINHIIKCTVICFWSYHGIPGADPETLLGGGSVMEQYFQ